MQGVLFAYRTTIHSSTKYSPFFLLYQREPILPVDVMNSQSFNDETFNEFENDLNEIEFSQTVEKMLQLRGKYYIINII